jgi:hypothetical protein
MKNNFSRELLELSEYDLSVRDRLLKENKLSGGYHPEMESVHRYNAQKLREIIQLIGFPTILKVGKEANKAAWLIIQHAIAEPEFMKEAYQLMLKNSNDNDLKNLAYLFDRIQFFQGKPQKFATQLNSDGTIYPVINKDEINELRIKNNLPILSPEEIDRILPIEDIERNENENPDYLLWRKKTGWI